MERALRMAALWDEVKDRLHGNALSLSGGQQQRLCIARALAMNPRFCSWMNRPPRSTRWPRPRSRNSFWS